MTAHVVLLRAVNVGGTKKLAMAELRGFAAGLGFSGVQTLLQSGNLVLTSKAAPDDIERQLEQEAASRIGIATEFFVRTAKDWSAMIVENPFADEAARDPARLVAMALKAPPTAAAMKALEAAITGSERVRAIGRTLYAVYPQGQGESRLTNKLIESRLGTRGTARNWNTVTKLAALAAAM